MTTPSLRGLDSVRAFGRDYALADARASGYRWWKPLVTAVLALALLLAVPVVAAVGSMLVVVDGMPVLSGVEPAWMNALDGGDANTPAWLAILLDFGSGVAVALLVVAAYAILRRTSFGVFSSVAGHLRWPLLARSALPALVAVIVLFGGSALASTFSGGAAIDLASQPRAVVTMPTVVLLLVVPLQSAAEEYLFRGYLLQMIAGWTRLPVVGAVVASILFGVGHAYGPWGIASVVVFGLAAGYATLRTGGLESAIVLHAFNNLAATLSTLYSTGTVSSSGDAGPVDFGITVVAMLLWIYAIDRLQRRVSAPRTQTAR